MVNKGALRSKMRKKQGNKMILCIVAVCEFIGLIVYLAQSQNLWDLGFLT